MRALDVRRALARTLVVLATLLLVGLLARDALRLVRVLEHNRELERAHAAALPAAGGADAALPSPVGSADAPASTQFVRAHASAAAGRTAEALLQYQAAGRDRRYTVAAQYNLGNLHLREALSLQERGELQNNPQPVELAKRHYRAALRADPAHWASKYNLERALQLAPETAEDSTPASGHAADRAVTSLRGFTLGLP